MSNKMDETDLEEVVMEVVSSMPYAKHAAIAGVFLILVGGAYMFGRVQGVGDTNKTSFVGNVGEALDNVFKGGSDDGGLATVVDLEDESVDSVDSNVDDPSITEIDENIVIAELDDENATENEDTEVIEEAVLLCEYGVNQYPVNKDIVINEVAWMGTDKSSTNEWIELRNRSGGIVSINNWQLIDKGNQIHIVFSDALIGGNSFILLERSSDDTVPSVVADVIYSGSLSNSNEGLRLFNASCSLIDEVLANPDWEYGDNNTKRTLQRNSDLSWSTSGSVLGTPKAQNGEAYIEEVEDVQVSDESSVKSPLEDNPPPPPLPEETVVSDFSNLSIVNVVYDVEGADGGKERIEIKNDGSSDIDLSNGSIQYLPGGAEFSTIRKKNFEDGNVISAGGTFIIGVNCHSSSLCIGVQMSWSQALGNDSGQVFLVGNKEKITGASDSDVALDYSY